MKKKVLTLIVIAALGFSSCQKDDMATPSSHKLSIDKVADKSDAGSWD